MSIGLNTNEPRVQLRQDNFKMDELGGERPITIGKDNKIVKAEIKDASKHPQHKPHTANTGLEGVFKATIDKFDWWHSAGKLRRAQDAIEVNLGRMAGKLVNLQALFVDEKVLDDTSLSNIRDEKNLLLKGIAAELSAFVTEIESLGRSYSLPREDTETLFLNRLINGLEKNNRNALNSLKAAVGVVATIPNNNPVQLSHGTLINKFHVLLGDSVSGVVAEPVDQRTGLQKLGDALKSLFSTKEQNVRQKLHDKLNGLEQLCKTGSSEMVEFTNQLRSLRKDLNSKPELTMEAFDAAQKELDTIIGETIKRGKEIAEKALEMEPAKMPGQLPVDKYQPQLVAAKEANRDLSKLFLYKNATFAQAKNLQSPLDEKAEVFIRNYIRRQDQSLEAPKGARAVAQLAVNSVNDMTLKFVAARQELTSIGAELSAITLAKQLAAKGDTPPVGVDADTWREACSVMANHLLKAPGSLISDEDVPALHLIKANEAQFTEGLEGIAVQRFEKLFIRLDAITPFKVTVPKPSQQQIEEFKLNGEERMRENAEQFGAVMQKWQNSAPKTGIPELDRRLVALRTPLALNSDKLDEASLRGTLSELKERITDIKSTYSYEMASALSGIGAKEARLDQRTKLFAALNTELQGLMRMEADLHGMINMRAMGQLASEGLDMLRQSCPEGVDRGAWESDCNAIVDFIMAHPHAIPGQETVATFERLLDTLNKSLSSDNEADKNKVELYKSLKDDLTDWKDWGFIAGMKRDRLNNMGHMNDVLESVSKMTNARIRISDTVNLMHDSFIALTKAGLPHADELRSNLAEYTRKLMDYADAQFDADKTTVGIGLLREETQELLSKTVHSFFPAMEFLAEQEHLYEVNPGAFTVDKMQQMTDLRMTMTNAYEALFDISRNVGTLGLDASKWVSFMLAENDLTEEAALMHEVDALADSNNMGKFSKMSRVVTQENPLSQVLNSMIGGSNAEVQFRIHMGKSRQITKLLEHTMSLTKALAEAKANKLDPTVARSIERLFSYHVLSPTGALHLDSFFPDKTMRDNFENNFGKLHQSLIQTFSTLQSFNLNVTSTQTKINLEAQNYLRGCPDVTGLNKKSQANLEVVASRDYGGKMSRILIKTSKGEEPRSYEVSLIGNKLTFTPSGDKSDKNVFTALVSTKNGRFPNI